jgi:uncharacterized protein (TIGR04255 family)
LLTIWSNLHQLPPLPDATYHSPVVETYSRQSIRNRTTCGTYRGSKLVGRGADLPIKLKNDAITEAVLEIRYEAPSTLPESTYIRLADTPAWKDFQQTRMPAYEIPQGIRALEPNLKYQPVIQLTEQGREPRAIRLGTNVVSYHRLKGYVGWQRFRPELEAVIDRLFEVATGLTVSRLGLRYQNAFTAERHGIASITDLDLSVRIATETLSDKVNVNYVQVVDGVGECTVRVATPNFVSGSLPDDTTAFVDVDVATVRNTTFDDKKDVKEWLVRAHDAEKSAFFHLLTAACIQKLKER